MDLRKDIATLFLYDRWHQTFFGPTFPPGEFRLSGDCRDENPLIDRGVDQVEINRLTVGDDAVG